MSTFRHSDASTDGAVRQWTKAGPVEGPLPAPDLRRLQETEEATVAEPAPLGLFGFATGTFAIGYVLSGFTTATVATFLLMTAAGVFPKNSSTNTVLAIELFCFAYISLLFTAAAARLNAVFAALLAALVPGFALSGLALIGESAVIGHVGGYFLILSAIVAFYAASALVMNAMYGRTVLPLFGRA
jgi:succinate-acetate transporter protein